MALLHGLRALGFRKLVICHLDHSLRGGVSAADSLFVANQARNMGVPCIRGEVDVRTIASSRGISLETAAREARQEFFATCARAESCNRIFLGHHADDQVETILHHFFRGSGRRGLAAMGRQTEICVNRRKLQILRPMIEIPRSEIEDWLRESHIPWREDASNSSPLHSRNRIRHELVPLLEKILGRNFREPVLRASAVLGAEDDWINEQLAGLSFTPTSPTLPVDFLRAIPVALRRRAVLQWLRAQKIDSAGFREVEAVLRLLDSGPQAPARVNLPQSMHARRRAGRIFLAKSDS